MPITPPGMPHVGSARLLEILEDRQMKYYDLQKNWRRVRPHLTDKKLNNILVRDFNRYTFGRWGEKFTHGRLPHEFEGDWSFMLRRRGRHPAFWRYTRHGACHWLVNFNLRLAMLVMPDRPWRILTSARHSTVWDGGDLIFDFNFQAFGVDPNRCFYLACHKELPPGKYRRVYLAVHHTVEQSRQTAQQTSGIAIARDPACRLCDCKCSGFARNTNLEGI
jgi:hypothetical protein